MTSTAPFSSSVTSATPLRSHENAQVILIKGKRYRQRPLGPAPCASFEDSSDELDSPPETSKVAVLPGITEDPASQLQTPVSPNPSTMIHSVNLTDEEAQGLRDALAGNLDPPAPPRIDISRASSSSQHEDSITSSPENDLGPQNLGYKEDGALDLKSSTEELDYVQEPGTIEETEAKRKREKMMKKQLQLRHDFGDTQSEHGELKERKDSACSVISDVGLLYIGGRTSRLSSVGSAASGGSAASHLSGTSHLSVGSHISRGSSRGSRSPSPHKTLLETSFCGAKPMHMVMSIEPEATPSIIGRIEKPPSRPPSRYRSRSPSPHKMLLETSFCGTKQIVQANTVEQSSEQFPSNITTEVEVVKAPQENVALKMEPKTDVVETTQPKLVVKKDKKIENPDEIQKIEEINTEKVVPKKVAARRPVNLAKMLEQKVQQQNKPRKVISVRDLPGNEIFIPLTGPEVDLEALVRSASPNPVEAKVVTESADVIYIPLHSPPKSDKEKQFGENTPANKNQSPSKNINLTEKLQGSSVHKKESYSQKTADVPSENKFKPYEVCEDGSIYIPLHTPEEEKQAKTFEEEIKRVEIELRRVKAAEAERQRLKRINDSQQKPATLNLERPSSKLSQHYVPGKQEQYSGGSRSPSPGSSLSRRSSFASIFRRSDVSVSPESPLPGHIRKKSGTFTSLLREAADGIKDRSRSRSKSKDRQSIDSGGISRSPSIKKNVFGTLFGKKREDEKNQDKMCIELTKLDDVSHVQPQTHCSNNDPAVDYIIIPLKDENSITDNQGSQAEFDETDNKKIETIIFPSPLEIQERKDTLASSQKSKNLENIDISTKISLSTVMSAYREPSSYSVQLLNDPPDVEILEDLGVKSPPSSVSKQTLPDNASLDNPSVDPKEEIVIQENVGSVDVDSIHSSIQQNSIELQDEELNGREELVAVSTDGVRTLKLPPEPSDLEEDHERKGLVVQDSFEEELPYVPTTLPLERGLGVQLKPVKERATTEVKTFSIDRPRSTTPMNPSALEDYVSGKERTSSTGEPLKMIICLPKEEILVKNSKSPRRLSGKGKTWFEFAEEGLQSPRDLRKVPTNKSPSPPPPLPPRSVTSKIVDDSTAWVNFEDLPEKRKLPKRITTVPPLRNPSDEKGGPAVPVLFSYVNPENCQCECHEHGSSSHSHGGKSYKIVTGKTLPNPKEQQLPSCRKSEGSKSNGEIVSDCECCANFEGQTVINDSKKSQSEEDIEELPLLSQNSDDESLEVSVKDEKFDWSKQSLSGTTLQVDVPNLSDSSFECSPNGIDRSFGEQDQANTPFAMDLDVQSSRSSIISQEEDPSSEDTNLQ